MPSAKTAKAVKSKNKDQQWTVMVFMGVATEAGNVPMFDAADADLQEMAHVGSGGPLKLFVQMHGQGVPQRARIEKTKTVVLKDVPPGERSTTGGRALGAFIRWALAQAGHRRDDPDHYSMLILWGHAYGFAIGAAPTRDGSIDALDFDELSSVLKRLQAEFLTGQDGEHKLDILGFDACDIATVEMACQLQPFAKYLLGSQIGVPIPGWPYDRILDRLRHPVRDTMTPVDFGTYTVRRYCESYTARRIVSLTMLDLERAFELRACGEVLAATLMAAISRDEYTRDRIASLFVQSQTMIDKPFIDVADLCLNLIRWSGDPVVMEAARALGDFLISPEARGEVHGPFVVVHGRNASQTARLNGVSLYAPHVAPINDADAVRGLYEKLTFSQVTRWSDLVNELRRSS